MNPSSDPVTITTQYVTGYGGAKVNTQGNCHTDIFQVSGRLRMNEVLYNVLCTLHPRTGDRMNTT